MANVVKAEVEAAFKLLKENGFKGVPDEAANGGLVMVGNGANITINVNNGVIGDNNTNVGSNIINSGVNEWLSCGLSKNLSFPNIPLPTRKNSF
jgi:hypothetical protein